MTKTSYANTEMNSAEQRSAALAGTRMLVAEEMFDAILELLTATGTVSTNDAALMLHRLADRLVDHATGRTQTEWSIVPAELLDQATRLTGRAALLRGHP